MVVRGVPSRDRDKAEPSREHLTRKGLRRGKRQTIDQKELLKKRLLLKRVKTKDVNKKIKLAIVAKVVVKSAHLDLVILEREILGVLPITVVAARV